MSKVEVITGRARRTFTPDEKAAILAESMTTGESMTKFCKRIGVAKPTLSKWQKEARTQTKTQSTQNTDIMAVPVQHNNNTTQLVDASFENRWITRVTDLEQDNKRLTMENFELKAFVGKLVFENRNRAA